MKRIFLLSLACLLVFAGCGIVPPSNSEGEVDVESNPQPADLPPENPPADSSPQPQAEPEPEPEPEIEPESKPAQAPVTTPPASSQPEPSSAPPVSSQPESSSTPPASSSQAPASQWVAPVTGEVRAVWMSYLEFLTLAQNKSESQFTYNIATAFNNVADAGFNSVWVHVRPFGDALYPSKFFPFSYVLTGEEGGDPGYDPLAIMVREAHLRGLSIEAWINPYRVRAGASDRPMCSDNPARTYLNNGSDAVIQYDNIISYNPASQTARDLIVSGVVEIIENYDIDGIHFDDYFYPTTDPAFDSVYYNAYRAAGGNLSLENWRRDNVNKLIAQVYRAVKNTDSRVLFGISPQANRSNNYHIQFADVDTWLANPGYIDYICPQVYFGFNNETLPFASTVREWASLIQNGHTQLYVGIAAYKVGSEDAFAGSGSREWITSERLLARMVDESRSCYAYGGFSMYRYDFLFSPASGVRGQMTAEMDALQELLKD
jgi:uncharacterized lipoprotein YddW (UPF0748 family)